MGLLLPTFFTIVIGFFAVLVFLNLFGIFFHKVGGVPWDTYKHILSISSRLIEFIIIVCLFNSN